MKRFLQKIKNAFTKPPIKETILTEEQCVPEEGIINHPDFDENGKRIKRNENNFQI